MAYFIGNFIIKIFDLWNLFINSF